MSLEENPGELSSDTQLPDTSPAGGAGQDATTEHIRQSDDKENRVAAAPDDDTLAIEISHMDRLKSKIYLRRPCVRVHFVDYDSGAYLRRTVV
jgi:hypothetical protein